MPELEFDIRKRLREIRDIQRHAKALTPERNELIREAADRGDSQREIAKDAGLSKTSIVQITGRKGGQ